jgi:hypothetical protein
MSPIFKADCPLPQIQFGQRINTPIVGATPTWMHYDQIKESCWAFTAQFETDCLGHFLKPLSMFINNGISITPLTKSGMATPRFGQHI